MGTSAPFPAPAPTHAHCPPRQGWMWERQLLCYLGSSSSAVTSLSDLLSRQCRCTLGMQGKHQMQGASWQVTGLQTSMLIRMWQQDQTCKVQWQIGEQLSRWEQAVTLPFASGNYNITHAFTQVLWPYCTIGLFLWGFLLQLNGVTGIKEFDKKTKNSWHCSS